MKLARLLRFAPFALSGRLSGTGLAITRNCDRGCTYCGVSYLNTEENLPVPEEKHSDLPVRKWKEIVDILVKSGRRHFVFTGGEPLLYADFGELARYAYPKALVSVVTGGHRICDLPDPILDCIDMISISVDGFTASEYSFKPLDEINLAEIMRRTAPFGIDLKVILVVHRHNMDQIIDLAWKVSDIGADILLSPYHSVWAHIETGSTGSENTRNSQLKQLAWQKQDVQAIRELSGMLKKAGMQGLRLAESNYWLDDLPRFVAITAEVECIGQHNTGSGGFIPGLDYACGAGVSYMGVDSLGRLCPCHGTATTGLQVCHVKNWEKARNEMVSAVPSGCFCIYDCIYNAGLFRAKPLAYITQFCQSLIRMRRKRRTNCDKTSQYRC